MIPSAAERVLNLPLRRHLTRYIGLKLAITGLPRFQKVSADFLDLTEELVRNHQELSRRLSDTLPPVDQRIQDFLEGHLADVAGKDGVPRLPSRTFVLDRPGVGREISVPAEGHRFKNDYVESYRLRQGVLHNPVKDRRTTQGVFHVAEGGLPVPPEKISVPKRTFMELLRRALVPPSSLLELPYHADQPEKAETMVSLLLRPLVIPAIPGVSSERTMEVRFFAPGGLVSNLDFVESIFGNGGDPALPENDAALDTDHWTGTTGCVILAPHLTKCTKKELGLPKRENASERNIREGMFWEDPTELYNNGSAFKVTCRTEEGVIVTVIADNYFGYCKKEVKTQIGYTANLIGNAEEEHAGGALAFASYSLGDRFQSDSRVPTSNQTYAKNLELFGDIMEAHPDGYAIDRNHPDIVYVHESATLSIEDQMVRWKIAGREQSMRIQPGYTYVLPSGYKVHMERHPAAPSWRLVGTNPEGVFCHKPCTVSGGGKSEISKSIMDAADHGPIFIGDFGRDMDQVEEIINRDYSDRHPEESRTGNKSRPVLSSKRSLGSVIKLLTPSHEYTDDYNAWLETIPDRVKSLVFTIKRFYREEWGANWREHFGADLVNGEPGHILKYHGRRLVGIYLRIGMEEDGSWRMHKVRQDFCPASKVQMEDDITASTVVPNEWLGSLAGANRPPSIKLARNCEYRLFQRPDDAIHRGVDIQTERDLSGPGNFLSNYQPLTREDAREMLADTISLNEYTEPMQQLIRDQATDDEFEYFCVTSNPRIVDGKPTKNPRYLQVRPDLVNTRETWLAEIGTRLARGVPMVKDVVYPVDSVLGGRRNNPPDEKAGIRPLAVYNPIHYQEYPELFMDFICSLTGKSPSTTGAGSEGALTKGPFNAIHATADLNNALVALILCDHHGFTTAAGYIGPKYRVDHDISLLIPEIWCRLSPRERDAAFLIEQGCFEKVEDFEHEGRVIHASRLGYRMTANFARLYLGRVFDSPTRVFTEEMLRPEKQGMDIYIDGILNITEAQQWVAQGYLDDGSVHSAIPPLQALLYIMATGSWNGKSVADPEVRSMFTREYVLGSDWYRERLERKRDGDMALWKRHVAALENFLAQPIYSNEAQRLGIPGRLETARRHLKAASTSEYTEQLVGTIGTDCLHRG